MTETAAPTFSCSSCGQPVASPLACRHCGLLALVSTDNPFVALGLPEQFAMDEDRLQKNYLEVSRTAHPDRHVNADDETQERAEAVMDLANRMRGILLDPHRRAEVLLALQAPENQRGPTQPDGLFLMEVMEKTEAFEDGNDATKESIREELRTRLREGEQELDGLWQSDPVPYRRIRERLDELVYWRRLLENATGKGEHRLVK